MPKSLTPEAYESGDSLLPGYARESEIINAAPLDEDNYYSAVKVKSKNKKWKTHEALKK